MENTSKHTQLYYIRMIFGNFIKKLFNIDNNSIMYATQEGIIHKAKELQNNPNVYKMPLCAVNLTSIENYSTTNRPMSNDKVINNINNYYSKINKVRENNKETVSAKGQVTKQLMFTVYLITNAMTDIDNIVMSLNNNLKWNKENIIKYKYNNTEYFIKIFPPENISFPNDDKDYDYDKYYINIEFKIVCNIGLDNSEEYSIINTIILDINMPNTEYENIIIDLNKKE